MLHQDFPLFGDALAGDDSGNSFSHNSAAFVGVVAGYKNTFYIFISLKMFELDDYRSTKVNIFKLFLDISLKMWFFDAYGY
jgi:hypothetical protein